MSRRRREAPQRGKARKRKMGLHKNADSIHAKLVELPEVNSGADVTSGAPTPLHGKARTDRGDAA
jgi:hypothetical protein